MENEFKPSRELKLPAHLCEAAEKMIHGSRFSTLEAFLTYLLQDLTSRNTAPTDERERQAIERRLRDLGYL